MASLSPEALVTSYPIEVLPNEVLIFIFSKLDWRSLLNVKKTCKLFYSITENNLQCLQKPKLRRLLAKSIIKEDTKCTIQFSFVYNRNRKISIKLFNVDVTKKTDRISEIEYLLERMDLNGINEIVVNAIGATIIFDVLNRHLPSNMKIEQLNLSIKDCPVFESFVKFIEKLYHLSIINIKHLCFGNQKVPSNYTFPTIYGIEHFNIKECARTQFFNLRMLENLVYTNKELNQIAILTGDCNIEASIINAIRKNQNLEHKEDCNEDYYSVVLPYRNPMNAFEQLKNYYKNSPLTFDEDLKSHNSMYVSLKCNICEAQNYIHFVYLRPEHYWEDCC